MASNKTSLTFVLRRISALCGNIESVQFSLNELLTKAEGFKSILIGSSSIAHYSIEIETQKRWLNIEAEPHLSGFSDLEWNLILSAVAGTIQRISQSQSYQCKAEDPLATIMIIKDQDGRFLQVNQPLACLLYTSPSPRDRTRSRMPSSA